MNNPQFGRIPVTATAVGAAANTAKDGSGTLITLVTGRFKVAKISVDATADTITVENWPAISAENQVSIFPGDRVSIISGTAPGGLTNNTEYMIVNLTISGTAATFQLLNPSNFNLMDMTNEGSNCIMSFPGGTRIDIIEFRSAQASRAASSAMTFCIFKSDSTGSNFQLIGEVASPTVTASASGVGASVSIVPIGGLILNRGEQLAYTQSVYAGVQDRTVAVARGAHF